MSRFLLIILALVALSFGQLSVRIAENNPTQFIIGEKVFVAVFIDGVSGNGSEELEQGTAPYVLENVFGNASFLKPNGRPAYNSNLDNAYYHWQNNQNFWLELSGYAPSVGNYSGRLRVRNTLTGEQAEISYSFKVTELPSNYYGVVIAMHDSAASYGRQMEIYTSLKNTTTTSRTLQSPYIDYYGTRQSGRQPLINIWKKPSNGCVQVLDCGQGNFVIRHRFSGDVHVGAGARTAEFQVGYNEIADSYNLYYYSLLQDKDIGTFLNADKGYNATTGQNAYVDYSAPRWATNYTARAMQRNLFYNPNEALYDHSGKLLWGSSPSWFSEQGCSIVRPTEVTTYNWQKFRTNSTSGFCTDGMVNSAPSIQFPTAGSDTIYEGEDYFLRPIVTDADGDNFTMELTGSHPSWIEVGTPADYWDDYENVVKNNVNTEANRRAFYIRSKNGEIRKATVKNPGSYTYTVKVTDSFGASSTANRTVVVLDGSKHPQHTESGLAVLIGDETWFKKYQLDIASGIVNYSNGSRILSAGWHYDYYGTHEERQTSLPLLTARYWYTDSNVDTEYKSCGDKRFRIRYIGRNNMTLLPNRTYQDSKVGFVYGTGSRMTKSDDWSIGNFYAEGDTLRRRRYAPKTPLYDGDGTLLWGETPSWAADCEDDYPSSSSNITMSSSSSQQSSCSSISSSSFNPFKDLAILFEDNSNSQNTANFSFQIQNRGNVPADIGNYELRFYYNGNDTLNASEIVFESFQNYAENASKTTEQCDENLYVLKVKLAENISVAASQAVPNQPFSVSAHLDSWQNYDWKGFASWIDVSDSLISDNPKSALFDAAGNLVYGTEMWPCNGYTKKQLKLSVKETVHNEGINIPSGYVNDAVGSVSLEFRNDGDSSLAGPVYVDFYVTHAAGQVPLLTVGGDTLYAAGTTMSIGDGVNVLRISSGNKHTFRFAFTNGLLSNSIKNLSFKLLDQCLFDCSSECENFFVWNFSDDWSAKEGSANPWNQVVTNNVIITDFKNNLLYGTPDPSAPAFPVQGKAADDTVFSLTHPRPAIPNPKPNRTDAVLYSMGQLLSGGDFETDYLHGWSVSGTTYSVRENSPQGSRHLELASGARITQALPLQAGRLLADSGATLTIWHTGNLTVQILRNETAISSNTLSGGSTWRQDTLFFNKSLFENPAVYAVAVTANGAARVDDAVLILASAQKPSTYAVRFTNTAGEELETRAYDGAEKLLITDSERDAMGRTWKKYLPFALPCKGALDCNSERKTEHNPGMAKSFYTAANPDYPDAGGVPYVETKWKPDPMATKDVEGTPGRAFGVTGVNGRTHLVKSYSSGVNLSGINLLDSVSLNSAVSAVYNGRAYDGDSNYHAAKDAIPTHLWELNADQDGRRSFTVKDGESHIVVSGSLDSTGNLLTRSVNELDTRGNVIKAHPPVSCSYTPKPASCVIPSEFGYDAQSRMIWSKEPDAGETRTFYDLMGHVRATQTQRQIDSGAYSITVYDNHDRPIYTGEWKTALDSGDARAYFGNVQNRFNPTVAELTPGTVTRMFYDRIPTRDTLDVELYPANVSADVFKYGKTRTMAVISDVSVDSAGNVIRISTANAYDKYGRITANYAYNPAVPADSLKMLAVETEYDLGGKVTKMVRYPYGVGNGGKARKIAEHYTYDRLGRIDSVFSKNGSASEVLLAAYAYYPTGNVKTVTMGNSITLTYTYHISGAVKTAAVQSADGNTLYSETLYYEDCGDNGCTPQYNGNISRMVHELAHGNTDFSQYRDVAYAYDQLNRLTKTDDIEDDYFDEIFAYDPQGRMTVQHRDTSVVKSTGGEYNYYENTNKLKSITNGMGGTADNRNMSDANNFVYDSEGNLIEDKSKKMRISYDWRGMPVEFVRKTDSVDSLKLLIRYDGSGKRISKTSIRKVNGGNWDTVKVTHYTGIGTEIREYKPWNFTRFTDSEGVEHCISANPDYAGTASTVCPLPDTVRIVVPLPNGLGRYALQSVAYEEPSLQNAYEFYLKDHLGSTRVVYGTGFPDPLGISPNGVFRAAYDYRSFGEQLDLFVFTRKVTENFTGKEKDDETELGYWGARYLDLMLGMWISVDPKRQFSSPYLYAGNGFNAGNGIDEEGNIFDSNEGGDYVLSKINFNASKTNTFRINRAKNDPYRLYKFYDSKNGETFIEPRCTTNQKYKKIYEVYIPNLIVDEKYLPNITSILIGHELDHPYEFAKPGHNALESVHTEDEYFDKIKIMSEDQNPDPIYKHDYESAKEMGIYDEY